jgi:hypothetical protein
MLRKTERRQDAKTCPDNKKFSKKELDKALSALISDEEMDNKVIVIICTFKDNHFILKQ